MPHTQTAERIDPGMAVWMGAVDALIRRLVTTTGLWAQPGTEALAAELETLDRARRVAHAHTPRPCSANAEAARIMRFLDDHQGSQFQLSIRQGCVTHDERTPISHELIRSAIAGYIQANEQVERAEFLTGLAESDPQRRHIEHHR